MYLASLTFLIAVLPLLLLCYYCIPAKGKEWFLLGCGLLIYAWGSPLRLIVPIFYVLLNYGAGLLLHRIRRSSKWSKLLLLIASVLQCYGLILVRGLADGNRRALFPIGIAFVTLMGIGYLIQIYRGKITPEQNLFKLMQYLTFFPIMYAGPIVTYPEFREQLQNRRTHILQLGKGIGIFVLGLAEKVMLADTLWYVFQELRQTETESLSFLTAWLTVTAFSLYLYFELLGYTEMARGLGECFGFHLPRNFRQPFFSSSVNAFFQNWNMTVGLWFQQNFRKFLFSRPSHRWIKYLSIVAMWMLIGLWYHTDRKFVIWGMLIGICIVAEQLFLENFLKRNYLLGLLYTSILLQFSWVLFFAESFGEAAHYWRAMIGFGSSIVDEFGAYYFTSYIALLLLCLYIATDLFQNITDWITSTVVGQKLKIVLPLAECVLLIVCVASLIYTKQPPFMWLML